MENKIEKIFLVMEAILNVSIISTDQEITASNFFRAFKKCHGEFSSEEEVAEILQLFYDKGIISKNSETNEYELWVTETMHLYGKQIT